MTNLVNQIKKDSITALKGGAETKATLVTLRLLIAELEKEKVAHKLTEVTGLTDEQTQAVIGRVIKKLDNEIEVYESVGKDTASQKAEKALLLTYMPEQLSEEDVRNEVKKAIGMTIKGEIKNPMQYLSKNLKGKTDMKTVQKIVKELSN